MRVTIVCLTLYVNRYIIVTALNAARVSRRSCRRELDPRVPAQLLLAESGLLDGRSCA